MKAAMDAKKDFMIDRRRAFICLPDSPNKKSRGRRLTFRNWLLFFLLAFLWGSTWSVMKVGLSYVPPTSFVLQRFVFSTIAMFPVVLFSRKRVPRDIDTLGKLLPFCVINAFGVTAISIGLVGESSGIGAVLTYIQPLFVFCFAISFLKEKVTAIKLMGTIMGFAGVVVLFLGRLASFTLTPSLLMILGAFLWAITIVYYKKFLSHVDSIVASFFQLSFGVIPLAALNVFTNGFVFPADIAYIWTILYTAVGGAAAGWTIWLYLLREEDATVLSGSSFIIPLVALIFGWQFLEEKISIESIWGSALILAGVYLVNFKKGQNRNSTEERPK